MKTRTWIDGECLRLYEGFLRGFSDAESEDPVWIRISDAGSIRATVAVGLAESWNQFVERYRAGGQDSKIRALIEFDKRQALLSFLLEPSESGPLALQVEPALVHQFLGGLAPAKQEVDAEIRGHRQVYLDIPPACATFGGKDLRAILVRPAGLCLTPRFEGGRLSWHREILDQASEMIRCIAVLVNPSKSTGNDLLFWRWGRPDDCGWLRNGTQDLDPVLAATEIEELVALAVLYRLHGARPLQTAIPRLQDAHRGRSPKKLRGKLKRFSLFRVVRLEAPPDRFGRPESDITRNGWKLGERIRVRGYFRLQPHGPGGALRRLQWIAAHEKGPADGDRKHDLHRLEAPIPRQGVLA